MRMVTAILVHCIFVGCSSPGPAVSGREPSAQNGRQNHLDLSRIQGLVHAKYPARNSNANCHAAAEVGAGILTVLLSLPQENCFQEVKSPEAGDIGFLIDSEGALEKSYHSFVFVDSTQIFQKADPGWNVNPFELVSVGDSVNVQDFFRSHYPQYGKLQLKWGRYVPSNRCYLTRFQNWISTHRYDKTFGPVIRVAEAQAQGKTVPTDQVYFRSVARDVNKLSEGSNVPADLRDGVKALLHEYLVATEFEPSRKALVAEKAKTARMIALRYLQAALKNLKTDVEAKSILVASRPRYTWLNIATSDSVNTAYIQLPPGADINRLPNALIKSDVRDPKTGRPWKVKMAPNWFFTQFTSGRLSILGQNISWTYDDERLSIDGVQSERAIRIRYPDGKEKVVPVPLGISDLKGNEWPLENLFKQIRSNTESQWEIAEELPSADLGHLEFDPGSLNTFSQIERIPIAVRSALRVPFRLLIKDHYASILTLVRKRIKKHDEMASIPFFAKCLTFSKEALGKPSIKPIQLQENVRPEIIDSCLGLISPSTSPLGDSLIDQPTPKPLPKLYFGLRDPLRPTWTRPALILVHASQDFHYPVTIKANMEKRIETFHAQRNPVVFILHNDRFNDASYFVHPQLRDLNFYSEDGKHPLCEKCPEVTFGGGYIDYCFGLAVRSYIANYFRENMAGEVQINFALDSIYTEAVTRAGEEGAKTALAEFHEIGAAEFIKKRVAQYLETPQTKDVSSFICLNQQPVSQTCEQMAKTVQLSDFTVKDRGGRFYPYLKENHFEFRIQVDGRDAVYRLGDTRSGRTIIFNLITKE